MTDWQIALVVVSIGIGIIQFFMGIILKAILSGQKTTKESLDKIIGELSNFRVVHAETKIDLAEYERRHIRLGKLEDVVGKMDVFMDGKNIGWKRLM